MRSAGAVCAAARHAPGTRRTAPPQKPVPARVTQARCLRRAATPSRHPHGPFSPSAACDRLHGWHYRAAHWPFSRVSARHVTALHGWHHRAAHWLLSCANARHAQLPTLVPFTRKYPFSPHVARGMRQGFPAHLPPTNARHVLEAPAKLAAQKPIPTQRRRRKAIPPGSLPALPGPSRTFPCHIAPAAPRCARHRRDAFPTVPCMWRDDAVGTASPRLQEAARAAQGPCKAAYPPHIPPPVPCAQFSTAPGMPHPSPLHAAAIMATGLAGYLTKPYKGMRPAAPTHPGLPAHAQSPKMLPKQPFAPVFPQDATV